MDYSTILTSLTGRNRRWGIRRASEYVKGFAGCLGDGFCPTSLMNVPADQWQRCLKEAESALTYSNPRMLVKELSESDIPDGGVMTFDCILTSTHRDRDGDILEAAGVVIDQKMPLLWQHMPIQPIGKFVRELTRNKRLVSIRCAIADIPLGRDTAALVKFGALRISHGFEPEEFEPLEDDKGEQIGWHIKKLTCMEVSTVSIPSNVTAEILTSVAKSKSFAQELDGIRTAYGRNLLETDLVKRWAKHFHDNRPTTVRGIELPYRDPLTVSEVREVDAAELVDEAPKPCSCGKSDAPVIDKLMDELREKTEKQSCTCPECGHRGPMTEFMGDYDDDKSLSLESRHFANLIRDLPRMRTFRDRLTTVLEAHQSRVAKDSGLDELLGIATSAARN